LFVFADLSIQYTGLRVTNVPRGCGCFAMG
jgi:hypothetical protein